MSTVAAEVVSAFTAATVTAFEEMTQTAVIPAEPRHGGLPADVDIAAEIRLQREHAGLLIVAFPRATLVALVGRYLPGVEPTPELLADAAGEFANVIAGQAKTMLKGTAHHFNLSTPRPVELHPDREYHLVPFTTDVGSFTLALPV